VSDCHVFFICKIQNFCFCLATNSTGATDKVKDKHADHHFPPDRGDASGTKNVTFFGLFMFQNIGTTSTINEVAFERAFCF